MNDKDVLEVVDICKSFGDVQALDHVSLALRKGEIHALLGENGAGKSTLMNIVYGLYQKDSGAILYDGKPQAIKSPRDALSLGIGMVPQFFKLVPRLTVLENIALFVKEVGFRVNETELRRTIEDLSALFEFGIEEKTGELVENLSVGDKQRVEIIKVLARGSTILLFDEATNVLAENEVESFLQVVRGLRDRGYTIVYITHRLREALAIADRISVFRKGRLVKTVAAEEASHDSLTEMMVGVALRYKPDLIATNRGKLVLEVTGLEVRDDRNVLAVRGVTFDLYEGEIVGLVGVEGNGSDQLAEALMGLRIVRRGSVVFDGVDITGLATVKRMEMGMSFIPSSDSLVPGFSVRDNSILDYPDRVPFSRKGVLRLGAISAYAEHLVNSYHIDTPNTSLHAGLLSGGNRQRLALGRKIEANPRFLVAYHPTKGLDVKSQSYIYEKLDDLKRNGKTVLFIGADLDEVLLVSDRVLVIYRGSIVGRFDDVGELSKLDLGLLMTGNELCVSDSGRS